MSVPDIFDRKTLRIKRNRAAAHYADHDFLIRETAIRLLDRLRDMNKDFKSILVIGSHGGLMQKLLHDMGYQNCIVMDYAHVMNPDVIADEEYLPIAANTLDCVISHMMLPVVNDVPGVLAQIRYALKPDGLFLGTTLGVNTLSNVQHAMLQSELELKNQKYPYYLQQKKFWKVYQAL